MVSRLGGLLSHDAAVVAASVPVRFREAGASIALWPHDAARPATRGVCCLPLGHQHSADSACPVTADNGVCAAALPRLAAVALALDAEGRLLLTRRPRSMSTFPGAWVLPGGSVDDADRTLAAAALRELEEETGLRPREAPSRPLCIWESCYVSDARRRPNPSEARDTPAPRPLRLRARATSRGRRARPATHRPPSTVHTPARAAAGRRGDS